jgi:hypothetical protein
LHSFQVTKTTFSEDTWLSKPAMESIPKDQKNNNNQRKFVVEVANDQQPSRFTLVLSKTNFLNKKVEHLIDLIDVQNHEAFSLAYSSTILFVLHQRREKVKRERRKEQTKKRREREKARITTIKQEYSRTFLILLQHSFLLPFDLYIYIRLIMSKSYI